jgi:hypothetical protein
LDGCAPERGNTTQQQEDEMTQTKVIPFEEAPFRFFHFHVAFSACGGEVVDGFELSIIGTNTDVGQFTRLLATT